MVMLMTPGLALFYGGMVQGKNVLSTFMHSFLSLGIVTIQWVLIGYSLSFGESLGGVVGGLQYALLNGVGTDGAGRTVPHLLFMAYQLMFAIITPALISGAFAERMKLGTFCLFTVLWSTLVYDPIAHWVWGPGGWLAAQGALDFAGGTVVHLSSGVSALVVAIVLGKRIGYPNLRHPPHNLTMTVLGAGLLWFGWFGFNAGSALTSGGLAAVALVNTHVAAAAGAVVWALVDLKRVGKATVLGVASGLVAGLVAITPAAGFVTPIASIAIGGAAGVVCYFGVLLKNKLGYDDALDAFGIHGIGGALGALLTGVFAAQALTPNQAGGLLAGHTGLMWAQLLGIVVAAAWSAAVTFGLLKLLAVTVGLRVSSDEEREGLDAVLHGEAGYAVGGGGAHVAPEPPRDLAPTAAPVLAREHS
jgi:Amt family ammonium transporter